MADRNEIVRYLDNLLQIEEFRDYCPNGLQVQGSEQINTLVAGVTASQQLIDQAIELQADAILVHHGYFWKGENQAITGMKYKRIKALLDADINLLAYHLPLDCHPQFGNNVQLGQRLGITERQSHTVNGVRDLLWQGRLAVPVSAAQLAQQINHLLDRLPMHLAAADDREISSIAWCTGGAQNYIEQAAELGVDAFISGEVSEQTFHQAQELNLHYFAAGHHASERYGAMSLAQHLAEKYAISTHWLEIANPV